MKSDSLQMTRPLLIVATITTIMCAAGFAYIYVWGPETRKPSEYEMREHITRRISDHDLRAIIAKSQEEVERKKKWSDNWVKDYWQKQTETRSRCMDEAYKIRNERECNPMIPNRGPLTIAIPTIEEQINMDLLGGCRYVQTVSEARKDGCLPER